MYTFVLSFANITANIGCHFGEFITLLFKIVARIKPLVRLHLTSRAVEGLEDQVICDVSRLHIGQIARTSLGKPYFPQCLEVTSESSDVLMIKLLCAVPNKAYAAVSIPTDILHLLFLAPLNPCLSFNWVT